MAGAFGRSARLPGGEQYRRVVQGGARAGDREMLLWHLKRLPPGGETRLGTSVGRKLGGAVRRNRVKRLLREAFRLNRHRLEQDYDLVAHPRPGCGWKCLGDAEASLLRLCRRAGILRASS